MQNSAARMTDAPLPQGAPLKIGDPILHDPDKFKPFAGLSIGEVTYQIGEDDAGTLMFREKAGDKWRQLTRSHSEGWHRVAAEVVCSTRDALRDFIGMHLIRLDGEPSGNGPFTYDLFGFQWAWKQDGGRKVSLHLPAQDWREIELPETMASLGGREKAIESLIFAVPDIHEIFAGDVEAWATRMSAGARIAPIM